MLRRCLLSRIAVTVALVLSFSIHISPSVAGEGRTVKLTPKNTSIKFVGIHSGDKPDPRTGHFQEFAGEAVISGDKLKSLAVEIETASLTTDISKLTNHLKSPDFFSVRQHKSATFKSTKIEPAEGNAAKVTGELTLLGKTQTISFPAKVETAGGLKLHAEFNLDRTKFGMTYGVGKIEKIVKMSVKIDG